MMDHLSQRVIATKRALFKALGPGLEKYVNGLKAYFRLKVNKEKCYFQTRLLCPEEHTHLHNQFFIALLNKIDATKRPKRFGQYYGAPSSHGTSRRKRLRALFHPYDVLDFIDEDNMQCIPPLTSSDPDGETPVVPIPRHNEQDMPLLDASFVLGRFYCGAFEVGLDEVDDSIGEYVSLAVECLIKNLISALITKKKHYKLSGNGSFYYDVGVPLRDPTIRNTVTRQKIDDAPIEHDKELTSPNFNRRSTEDMPPPTNIPLFLSACEDVETPRTYKITLRDCQNTLVDRNLIASHTVFAINFERMTQKMH